MTIRIVIADDHPVTRAGTMMILQHDHSLIVVGEAVDGAEALEACRLLKPDLVVLDVRLPELEGLLVAYELSSSEHSPYIIMLSAFADRALIQAALDAGVHGYALKSVAGSDLLKGIHRVMRGEKVLLGVDFPCRQTEISLSAQELAVLYNAANGLSTREIAQKMSCSPRTVETYLTRSFRKLGASSRIEAIAIAQRQQLLPNLVN